MMKLRKPLKVIFFVFFLVFVRTVPAPGQAFSGAQIAGTISDPAGAAVPNAKITVTQTNTQLVRTTISGSDGTYVLPDLPIGPYKLEVGATSFKTYSRLGIELQVGDRAQINVSLEVGTLSQTIQVTANANMVEVGQTAVSTVIDQQRIIDLPLNGRQAAQLVLLGGVSSAVTGGISSQFDLSAGGGVGKVWPTQVPISMAGAQANGGNWFLDGADNLDAFMNVSLPYPFPDALQEFNYETSAIPAQYGAHPGGVVNMATKAGTNGFHGDAFEFLRNGDLNGRNYFAATQDTLKRNQFGGTLGGPILKSKLFFFGGYQGTRNSTAPPDSIFFVPTQAALNGDFSSLESAACQSSGKAVTLTDPTTGLPFPNNQISPTRFNSSALGILKFVPISTDPCGKVVVAIPSTGNENQYVARGDWNLSEKHSIFARYFYAGWSDPSVWNGADILPAQRTGLLDRDQGIELGDTYALNSTTVNSFHVSGTRLRVLRGAPADYIGPQDFGINVNNAVPNELSLTVSGKFTTGAPGPPLKQVINEWQGVEALDMTRGRHHLTFGGELNHREMNEQNISCGNGVFGFNGAFTGDALVDFMLGDVNSFIQCAPDEEHPRQWIFGLYGEDVIHVNSKLTLTAGLRWEPFFATSEAEGKGSHFDLAAFEAGTQSNRYLNSPAGTLFNSDPGIPQNYTNNRLFQLGPRIGIGWDPTGTGQQVIRAAYGIIYNYPILYYNQIAYDAPPWGGLLSNPQPIGGLTNPWAGYAGGDPFPLPAVPSKDIAFPLGAQYETLPLNIRPTYMQQWNLSYQRQLGKDWLVSATYLGNHTVHMWLSQELNQAVYIPGICGAQPCSTVANTQQRRLLTSENPTWGPFYGNLDTPYDGGNIEYNALLLTVRHRFSQHFTLLSNYTWSHCIGDGDDQGELETSQFQNSNDIAADRGNCSSDIRQIFNTSVVATSPTFHDKWAQRLLGNWQFSPIISVASGPWFTVYTGTDNSLSGNDLDRPNQVLPNAYAPNKGVSLWLNPAAFAPNALGTFGDSGRNAYLGPGTVGIDMALSRFFPLGNETRKLEFRFEAFNVINHPNFQVPDSTLSDSTFGQILSAGDPRILQFALKLYF
jgi:hypothetical protein